jgi:hypothetical protein
MSGKGIDVTKTRHDAHQPGDEPMKGTEGGTCNRGVCSNTDARWWNTSTRKWYCDDCARLINEHAKGDPVPLCVTRVSLPDAPNAPHVRRVLEENHAPRAALEAARG